MNDGFWQKAFQIALLFGVIVLLGASIVIQSTSVSEADVRAIVGTEGGSGGGATGFPVDQSIRPDMTPIADLQAAPDGEAHVTYAPAVALPIARSDQRIYDIDVESIEGVCPLDEANGITTDMWGFRIAGDDQVVCGSPGPIMRGRVGDVVNITLTNMEGNTHPHNIDFHAVTGQGGGAADLTVNPGESATIQVRLMYPGAFMYHCATGDVPSHIAHGMYGMFIVDPETPLPEVDHEWAVVQSEWYVGEPDANGEAPFDRARITDENPRYVTFNGRIGALTGDNTLAMKVGERSRIYFVNEGLALDSNFHPIGSQWDVVYPEGATHQANHVIRGSQSTLVVAGGGTVVEIEGIVPQTILLVDHALARTFDKGALATVVVSGDPDPEVFGVAPAGGSGTDGGAGTDNAVVGADVSIPVDAFNPATPENAFDPLDVTVKVGTTIRWTNNDAVAHTVTSGVSDGTKGVADSVFDSGFVDPGDTWTYTFTEVGEFPYFCIPHPWMIGKVTVTE
jgi:nitrite reductase (NO-forming)